MAKETFSIVAIEETSNWDAALLEKNNFKAAFGLYIIRNGERTHICSLTPNSYCDFLENAFIYDSDDDAAHEAAGELANEGARESSDYFGFMDPETMDPRFVGEVLNFDETEIDGDLDANGRETEQYHARIWEKAREAFCDGNGYDQPAILWSHEYAAYQAELVAKRRALNRPVLATGGENMELFWSAAKRTGIDSYAAARAIGWL